MGDIGTFFLCVNYKHQESVAMETVVSDAMGKAHQVACTEDRAERILCMAEYSQTRTKKQ